MERETSSLEQQLRTYCLEAEGSLQAVCLHAIVGGRRTRGMLLLHAAERSDRIAVQAACAVELLHAATLLQDDIFDGSAQRRGRKAAHLQFGKAQTILASDWLLLRALELSAEVNTSFFQRLALAARTMTATVSIELEPPCPLDDAAAEAHSRAIYRGKTATLFAASLHAAALLHGEVDAREWMQFGEQLGCVYQLLDDCVDLYAPMGSVDKPTGLDLQAGRLTLPILTAVQQTQSTNRSVSTKRFAAGVLSSFELEQIRAAILSTALREQLERYAYSEVQQVEQSAKCAGIPLQALKCLLVDMQKKLSLCFGPRAGKEGTEADTACSVGSDGARSHVADPSSVPCVTTRL